MKHLHCLPILFVLLVSVCVPAQAFCAERPDSHNRTLRAGVFNFAGYHDRDDNGNLKGYGIDLLDLISGYSHLNFEPVGYDRSWADMLEMLKNGEIDIVTSARRTPEREETFAFSIPVGRNHTLLSKHVFNNKIQAGDYKTYDGMKIGAVAGSSQNKFMEDFAKNRGFSYTLIEYNSTKELEDALRDGTVDAILSSNLRKPHNETLLNIIRSGNFYAIVRKEDQDLINEINYAIQQMNINEGDWQNSIYYRHYGPDESALPQFSRRENSFISATALKDKKVRAVARKNIPPYSYVENGELKGILPDYFREAMKLAKLPYELVTPEDHAHYQDLVKSDSIDVVLDKIGTDAEAGSPTGPGLSTDPYMVTGLAMVTRADLHDAPRSVALPDVPRLNLRADLLKDKEIRNYPTQDDALNAVQAGEAEAAYVFPYTAQRFINSKPGSGLAFTMLDDN
ncbi:MAG: transporter substrate-binding domain-containing protein, partial [Desulfovibrio sp.]|nr:transporter substrate-binding domain-containing protein [Desulfovibrio sp.]